MASSFNKPVFLRWDVQSTPTTAESNTNVKYHTLFLPHKDLEFLKGHLGKGEDVCGISQQWTCLITDPSNNVLTSGTPPMIFALDSDAALDPIPTTEMLMAQNISVLHQAAPDGVAQFPLITGCKTFMSQRVSPGIFFNAGNMSKGFWLAFMCAHNAPFACSVFMRGELFVHNV